jgi:hypothetical protein
LSAGGTFTWIYLVDLAIFTLKTHFLFTMASSSQGVVVEIPGHTNAPAENPKPSSRSARPEDRYAPGAAPSAAAAAESGSQSWLQSNLYLILFCVGWLFFPCWWAGALLGLKAGRTGRSRFSRQEKTAWQACIALSIIGVALFLLFIIWYGADPQGAKATLIRYTGIGSPSNLQGASPLLSVSPSPSPSPVSTADEWGIPDFSGDDAESSLRSSWPHAAAAHIGTSCDVTCTQLVIDQCDLVVCRPVAGYQHEQDTSYKQQLIVANNQHT